MWDILDSDVEEGNKRDRNRVVGQPALDRDMVEEQTVLEMAVGAEQCAGQYLAEVGDEQGFLSGSYGSARADEKERKKKGVRRSKPHQTIVW